METTIKTNATVTGLTENYSNAIISIKNKINANKYVLKINGLESNADNLESIEFDLSKLTHSGRKKVAKRLWIYNQKGTIKSINYLFLSLNRLGVITDKVKVEVSHKEADIIKARTAYKKLRIEAEAARLLYKETKGDCYKQ